MEVYLQKRWRLEGRTLVYYGIRRKPYLLKNKVKLTKKEFQAISSLLKQEPYKSHVLNRLIKQNIVVFKEQLNKIPVSLKQAQFCKSCVANNFMIPGIEFDDAGLCPMCASKDDTKEFISILPMMEDFPKAKKSRFDIAVFYTGGKDSSYLLYYLAKVKGLRVLALTWEIPFISKTAKQSIENAKQTFGNVEFVNRRLSDADLKIAYKKLYELSGNTCACPSLAYILFYPLLVSERVPYFVAGNEPVQMKNLYYNNMAPPIAYRFSKSKVLNILINVFRVLTFRPPFKKGQFQALMTMKQLAYGDNVFKKLSGYKNDLIHGVINSLWEIPHLMRPLKRAIRVSSLMGNIPAFVHIDLDRINPKGIYKWNDIKELLVNEVGWIAPNEDDKGLHTSCEIEKCKEYTQFIRFYKMESTMIPFSAIELALATRDKNLNKEQAKEEIEKHLGFSLIEPKECLIMKNYFKDK